MSASDIDTCRCGSGLPFSECHGDPRNEFARAQALKEAETIPWMFPFVRVVARQIEAFADRAALDLGEDEPSDEVLNEGLGLVDDVELERVVERWSEPYADRWASLTTAAGSVGAAARALVVGALRAAIAERQPTPRELVEPLDGGALRRSPFAALSAVLPPAFVWSIDEARAARVAGSQRRARARMDAVEEVAYALMTFTHLRRTSALAARLASELPFAGLPNASETLARACEDVDRSLDAARTATAALLIAYAERLPRSVP